MLRKLFGKKAPATTVEAAKPTFDLMAGPRSNDVASPLYVRKESDWHPVYGLLWVRQNTNNENRYDPTPDIEGDCIKHINVAMIEDDIVKFMSEYLDKNLSHRAHLVILTADAYGMYPTHVSVEFEDGTTTIKSSAFCRKSNIDVNVIRLVQKMLDARNIKIDFRAEINNWNDEKALFIAA